MADMILAANELAFRTAYTTSSTAPANVEGGVSYNLTSDQPYIVLPNLTSVSRTIHQTALVRDSTPLTVFAVHRGWLVGGFTVMVLACLAILPTYWGWWELGREVSMSPLEIARAFEAPIMRDADSNATGHDLKKSVGSEWISLCPIKTVVEPTVVDDTSSHHSKPVQSGNPSDDEQRPAVAASVDEPMLPPLRFSHDDDGSRDWLPPHR